MAKQNRLRPYVKIHGGKYYLSDWVISHFPTNYQQMTYVEPYIGGGSVLLNKAASIREAANDIDPGIHSIILALKETPYEFISRLKNMPYSQETFDTAKGKKTFARNVDYAINEYVLRRMSRGGLKEAFGWSERQRGGQPGDKNAFLTMLQQLPFIAERFAKVEMFHEPALNVIDRFDDENTLVYCDPPYLPQTRRSPKAYEYEMTPEEHELLAKRLKTFKGKVIVSGYPSPLYDELYAGWNVVKKQIVNHASQQRVKQYKVETLWMNYSK